MGRVATLIEGFEDAYGLELLSSVHWVMQKNPEARANFDTAVVDVHKWNAHKRRTRKKEHILADWERLREQEWSEQFAIA